VGSVGLAEGLTKGTEGLGAVGLTTSLADYTNLGGTLMVFGSGAVHQGMRLINAIGILQQGTILIPCRAE